MYTDVVLEKGFYHLTGKSFTQALEERDRDEQYQNTPLENLDAYERQLKRFDIRVSGADCDCVEKFFTTTESAILFPEFIRRAIKQGMEDSILSELPAAHTKINGTSYKGIHINENNTAYNTITAEGSVLAKTSLTEESTAIAVSKYGRLITASYEIIRQQKLDVFATALRSIGMKLASAITGAALTTLSTGTTDIGLEIGEDALRYCDLGRMYGALTDFTMTTLVASPAMVTQILGFDEIGGSCNGDGVKIRLPFGSVLLKSNALSGNMIIGFDKRYALEMISGSDVILETDKLIDCQLDCISVSVSAAFKKLNPAAVTKLSYV